MERDILQGIEIFKTRNGWGVRSTLYFYGGFFDRGKAVAKRNQILGIDPAAQFAAWWNRDRAVQK